VSKIKDLLGIGELVDEKTKSMKSDLYKAIKELSEMQYKQVELETKLSNLEKAFKLIAVKP